MNFKPDSEFIKTLTHWSQSTAY